MKRVGVIVFYLLLIAATVGGIFFFRQNQDNAKNLAKTEGRLNEVKKAFEERGRLLDGLKISSDEAGSLSRKAADDLENAKVELKTYRTTRAKLDGLVADNSTLAKRLKEAQSLLATSQKTTGKNKVLAQERLEELQQKLADAKSLDDQLMQANNKIEKLKEDFSATEADLMSQKQLMKDKLAVIKEFEDLSLSPAQIKNLRAENTRLKIAVLGQANKADPGSVEKKMPLGTLKTLPLGLGLPLTDKRLTKPLRPRTIPKPTQP